MTEKERLQLRLQPETREKIERWQSAAGCRSMNEFVEKAVNFYVDYLASDDSGVLLSPAIQSPSTASCRCSKSRSSPCSSNKRWNWIWVSAFSRTASTWMRNTCGESARRVCPT